MSTELPKTCESDVVCGDLLAAHARKWSEVCNELEAMYPNANALLYVHGYVFGLRHAVAIASRKPIGQV